MMNLNIAAGCSSRTSKENFPSSSKTDTLPVQRAKQRTVLGVLSENEQRGRSGSQISKHSSVSDSSHFTFFDCASSSSFELYVEEACEVVLAASGQEVVSGRHRPNDETAALQNEDLKFLLELSSSNKKKKQNKNMTDKIYFLFFTQLLFALEGSCVDSSIQSEPDESLISGDVLCASEYTEDIYQHLREREIRLRPVPGYLVMHPEITSDMRLILVDWLVEVVVEYKLHSETLFLAVNYLDRFLSYTAYLKRSKLQLVGTAALMIAAKYEEISPPELREFVNVTDNTYSEKQLVSMEHALLRVLVFRMTAPTVNQFLRLFMSIHAVCPITENLALYVAELSLLEIVLCSQYTPSILAAGSYCLANYTTNKILWPHSLHAFTGHALDDIMPCLTDLHKLYVAAKSHPQQAIREKYKSSKYCRVSSITPPAALLFQ
ncbi:uncharacterized protein V6R79_008245 [Siganus canaliculatus]